MLNLVIYYQLPNYLKWEGVSNWRYTVYIAHYSKESILSYWSFYLSTYLKVNVRDRDKGEFPFPELSSR